jgi:hypothetical protein
VCKIRRPQEINDLLFWQNSHILGNLCEEIDIPYIFFARAKRLIDGRHNRELKLLSADLVCLHHQSVSSVRRRDDAFCEGANGEIRI